MVAATQALPLTFDVTGVAVISQPTVYPGNDYGSSYTWNFDVLEMSTFSVTVTGLQATGVSWGDVLSGGALFGADFIALNPSASSPNSFLVFATLTPGQWALSVDTFTAPYGGFIVGVAELYAQQGQTPAVPEPETWAMFGAGIVALLFLSLRLRSASRK